MAARKRGRPARRDFVTSWGLKVDGAYLSSDGRLRPIGKSKPAFGGDEATMVNRFLRWQADQGQTPLEPLDDIQANGGDVRWAVEQERQRLRNLILTDPRQAAVELDIPHLAHHPKTPDKPQFTLAELGKIYCEDACNKAGQPLAPKNRKNSETWWNEFLSIVNVRYARDLTKAHLYKYAKTIKARNYAAATERNRLVKVKAILNWGRKKTDDTKDYRAAVDHCDNVFDLPEVDINPQPMKVADFQKLLKRADTRMRAMLLLGLNCAMHGGEIGKTLKSDIDLKARTFEGKRSKTSKRRIAWLWKRTVQAIKAYQKEHPNASDTLFVSRTGRGLTGESIRQLYVTLRRQAGVGEDVKLDGLRDGAYTIACQVDSYYAKFVAGHVIRDESKKYVERGDNPNIKACCEAIERHYFPPKKSRSTKK